MSRLKRWWHGVRRRRALRQGPPRETRIGIADAHRMISHALPLRLVDRPVYLENPAVMSRLYADVVKYGRLIAAGRSPDGHLVLSYKFGVLRLLRIRADAADASDLWVINVLADTRVWPKSEDVFSALMLYCGYYALPLDHKTIFVCVRHFITNNQLRFA